MPAYSFKERFVPMILDLSKPHTIRKRRKKGFCKPGNTVYLYFGLRTKWCRKLGQAPCLAVKTIIISNCGLITLFVERLSDYECTCLAIGKKRAEKIIKTKRPQILSVDQKNDLAWADGFRMTGSSVTQTELSFALMFRWWKETHDLPFIGDIVYWNTAKFIHHKKGAKAKTRECRA